MKKHKFDSSEASMPASDFFGMNGEEISISACAIMRDEMAHAEAWLKNVRSFAAEIIVVDTGSQDGTRELLAQQADVKLICCEWQNDFAQAKNMALREAACDWIVFTDADECFYRPENIHEYLRQVNTQSLDVVFCPIDNIDADTDELIGSDVVYRMMRNHVGIRYIGAVHEQLTKGDEPWQNIEYLVADRKLAIRHTGYSAKLVARKHQRNYAILRQVMEHSSTPEMYYGFLSESLLGLDRYQEALENAILAMDSPYQPAIQRERFAQVAVEAMDKLGLGICDIFPQQQAEKICHMVLARNKWHEGTLCQWLDMELNLASQDDAKANMHGIVARLLELYGHNEHDKQQIMALLEKNGYIYLARELCSAADMEIGQASDMETAYQLLHQGEYEQLEKQLLPMMAQNIQLLFVGLLGCRYSAGSWYQEKLHLLPEAQQVLVQLYHGQLRNAALSPDEYITMLDGVLLYADHAILDKYLQLAQGMPGDKLKQIAHQLLSREHYEEALNVFAQIQAEDEAVDESFWFDCGKCLYYLQDYANAQAALANAADMGCAAKELEAYMAWCREAAAK